MKIKINHLEPISQNIKHLKSMMIKNKCDINEIEKIEKIEYELSKYCIYTYYLNVKEYEEYIKLYK